VVVTPALFLLASVDCYGAPDNSCRSDVLRCLFTPGKSEKDKSSSTDSAFDQALRRWSRRINIQPATDGLASPADSVKTHLGRSELTVAFVNVASTRPELASRWQFLCRTALEPRAPSLVS